MANFNLKYVFTPHLENPEELEKIHWNTSEEIFIDDNELDCLDVCYVIHDSTLSEEAAHELKNAFKLFEFENKWKKRLRNGIETTWRQERFNY